VGLSFQLLPIVNQGLRVLMSNFGGYRDLVIVLRYGSILYNCIVYAYLEDLILCVL
jgi:hypothetical protein